MFLKQSTTFTDRIGPFLDKTDGVTEETGLTTAAAAIFLSPNGGNFVAKNESTALSHDQDGWYVILYDATDTATVGKLVVMVQAPATHLPVWVTYWVLEEDIYEALFAASAAAFDSNDRTTADVLAISGDTTAADNLELQYDTTGLTGGTFPATQDGVGAIGTSGGAALNFAVADDNVDGALNGVTFVGVQTSGTFVSTEAEEGTNHVIDDTSDNIDLVYQFNIGGGRTATEVIWKGFLAGSGDSINIQLFDFVGSDWETRAVITGKNQSVNETIDFPILSKHTGTGANIGTVYVRFIVASATNPTLETDELIVEAVSIGQTVGYQNGQVWIDTTDGTAGTESFVNGTADNPVKSIADALTIATAVGLKEFHVAPASTITLGATFTNKEMEGHEWTLDLSGEDVGGSEFVGASVSGIGTGTGTTEFLDCFMGATTIPAGTHLINCDFEGTITLGAAGTFHFENCTHGSSSPSIVDFGSGLNSSTIHMHPYHGALEIQNMGAGTGTYVLHLNGDGILTFNANCSATSTINIAGVWDLTNNASGLTINDDGLTRPEVVARLVNPQVNTAFSNITFEMYDSTNHNPNTGLTVTGERSLDGAAYAGVEGTIAEISDGTYQFDAAAGDMNGALVVFRFSSSGADDTFVHVKTAA